MNDCVAKMLAIENKGQRQHHCPQCFKIAGPRCARKGHVVRCDEHLTYHSPYSECPQCKDARIRDERHASHASDGDGGGNNPRTNPHNNGKANNIGNGHGKRKDGAADKSGGKAKVQKKQKAKQSKSKG